MAIRMERDYARNLADELEQQADELEQFLSRLDDSFHVFEMSIVSNYMDRYLSIYKETRAEIQRRLPSLLRALSSEIRRSTIQYLYGCPPVDNPEHERHLNQRITIIEF